MPSCNNYAKLTIAEGKKIHQITGNSFCDKFYKVDNSNIVYRCTWCWGEELIIK